MPEDCGLIAEKPHPLRVGLFYLPERRWDQGITPGSSPARLQRLERSDAGGQPSA